MYFVNKLTAINRTPSMVENGIVLFESCIVPFESLYVLEENDIVPFDIVDGLDVACGKTWCVPSTGLRSPMLGSFSHIVVFR